MFNRFLKDASTLLSGMLLAQIINLLAIPIITRIFSPHIYGTYNSTLSFIWIFSIIATLKLEIRLPILPLHRAINLSKYILLNAPLLLLILTITACSFLDFDNPVFVFLCSLIVAISYIENSLLTKLEKYNFISLIRLLQVVIQTFLMVILGELYAGVEILLLSFLISRVPYFFLIVKRWSFNGLTIKILRIHYSQSKNVLKYTFPSSLLGTFSNQFPMILLASNFSSESAGYYGMVYSLLILPSSIISNSISNAVYSKLNKSNKESQKLLSLVTLMLCILSILIFIAVFLLSKIGVIASVLGEGWSEVSEYIYVLIVWLAPQFISTALTNIYVITNRNKELFVFSLLDAILKAIPLLFISNLELSLIYLALSGGLVATMISIRAIWLYHNKSYRYMITPLLVYLFFTLVLLNEKKSYFLNQLFNAL